MAGFQVSLNGRFWVSPEGDITFHVSVECQPGSGVSVADYDVSFFAVLPGVYPVKSTATLYIGKTQYCVPQSVSVSLVKATSAPGPAYVILGFSADDGEGEVSTHLEGILSVHFQEHGTMTEYVWTEDGGMKLHEESTPRKVAFYCFPVEAGEFFLGGFITQMFPAQVAQFEGYVNSYAVPLTKAAYIGSFHLSRTEDAEDKDRNSRPVVGSWVTEGHGRLNLGFDREAFKWMQTNLRKVKGFDIVISPSVTVR